MVAPSILKAGEKFCLKMSAVGPDQMPIEEPVQLTFHDSGSWINLPKEIELKGEPVYVPDLTLSEPGFYQLSASYRELPWLIKSNPVLVEEDPKNRLFFGDLHIHSLDGRCQTYVAKPPRFAFDYIRNISFLDFAAVSDHVRGLSEDKWEAQKRLVIEYDRPGEFVPFLGFESSHRSGRGGDNNAYFPEYDGEYFWLDGEDMRGNQPDVSLADLWEFLEGTGRQCMTVPHHTGRHKKHRCWDESWYNPEREWLFEIYSMWGSSEKRHSRHPLHGMNIDKPAYFQDAVAAGCRFGVIASSDDHTTCPGSETHLGPPGTYHQDFHRQKGMAAVFAPRLERKSLWKSFQERRTYATTFDRSIVLFYSEGAFAGSQISASSESMRKRRLSVRFIPCAPWTSQGVIVTLVRNGTDFHTWDPIRTSDPIALEYVDEESFDSTAVFEARYNPKPFVAYYVRIEYMYGGTVWSSPIWFCKS